MVPLVLVAACSGGSDDPSTPPADAPTAPPPAVAYTEPAAGATEVVDDARVTVYFDELVDPTTVAIALADDAGTAIAGHTSAWPDGAVFVPDAPLDDDRHYTASVTVAQAAPFSWEFATHRRAWGPPLVLHSAANGQALIEVRSNTAGDAFAVWRQDAGASYEVWAASYVPGTGWSIGKLLSYTNTSAGDAPHVVVDEAGNALAIWQAVESGVSRVYAAAYTVAGGWQGVTAVPTATGAASAPALGIDGAGDAIAVWLQTDGTRNNVWSARYSLAAGWSAAALIETDNTAAASIPQIAVNTSGDAVAVWAQGNGPNTRVWANRYVHGIGWGTATIVNTENGAVGAPQVALDTAGVATIVWPQADGANLTMRWTRGTDTWSPAAALSSDGGHAQFAQIGLDATGAAVVAWERFPDGIDVVQSAASGWTAPMLIGAPGHAHALAVAKRGRAVLAWSQPASYGDTPTASQLVANSWTSPRPLSSDVGVTFVAPAITVDPDGRALAVWMRVDNGVDELVASRFE